MSRKNRRSEARLRQRQQRSRRGFSGARRWWIAAGIAVIVVAGVWLLSRDQSPPGSESRLPGPVGGRDVSQDVKTLVGQRAPSFSLSTADGQSHMVTPGRGRPTVLIFHMGVG